MKDWCPYESRRHDTEKKGCENEAETEVMGLKAKD